MIIPTGIPIEEVLKLALKVQTAIDQIFDHLEATWTPEEMLVLFAWSIRGMVEFKPELQELAISQLSSALHQLQGDGQSGN
jgi:hypothetical protein